MKPSLTKFKRRNTMRSMNFKQAESLHEEFYTKQGNYFQFLDSAIDAACEADESTDTMHEVYPVYLWSSMESLKSDFPKEYQEILDWAEKKRFSIG
jgi:hypothetical protein